MSASLPLFVKRDLDGFFGLFVDNLVQLLLIMTLCAGMCGMTGEDADLVRSFILPGAAVSIVIGNLFYAVQAHLLARREGRDDVTALPYGINTPSLLVYVFFVMAPTYRATGSARAAWEMGLVACVGSGLIELCGSFVAEKVRRNTPRAALLATLAGIAITFIAMMFALQIWQRPLVAMLPFGVVMMTYFAHVRFPWGLPGGLVGIILGTLTAWGLSVVLPDSMLRSVPTMSIEAVATAWSERGTAWPSWCGPVLYNVFRGLSSENWVTLLSVILPMGLFNLAGSLQNIESAAAGGDRYRTGSSLAVNGVGTLAAALFGSCFPTTIYIGHPGWKKLGARAGYSTLNAVVIAAICLTGTVSLINSIVPMEAGIAIVLWIGIVITAQAYQATPSAHAPAVALGLFPAIAAWGATIVTGALIAASFTGSDVPTVQTLLDSNIDTEFNGFLVHGLNLLERGYIFTCMVIASIAALLIDRKFIPAAWWAAIAAVLTLVGLMHAYQISGNEIEHLFIGAQPREGATAYRAFEIAAGYALMAGLFLMHARYRATADQTVDEPAVERPSESGPSLVDPTTVEH